MRVILHAGFHKTGTTTVQKTLRQNRGLLKPHLGLTLRPGMVAVCESARAYSRSADPLDLAGFRFELAQLAEGWNPQDTRPHLLASEDLCGHMPGRFGLTCYAAAPRLMQAACETLEEILPGSEVAFFFSTRDPESWLASCYTQHLRATRLTQTRAEYVQTHRAGADLDATVDEIAAAVAPRPVHRCALGDSAARALGPLDPLLDLIGMPADTRAGIVPHAPANTAPSPEKIDRLLALNRGDLQGAAFEAAKTALKRADI